MTPIQLSDRLQAVADMVRPNSYFADIGTDHGYLPIYLVQHQRVMRAVAADVNPKPLEQARRAIRKHGLTEQIATVLSDGLTAVDPAVEDIAVAGMGGELIGAILSRTNWICDDRKRLLLQPMTQDDYLRRYLAERGFRVAQERYVQEGRHLYVIIEACYDGVERMISDCEAMIGQAGESAEPVAGKYLQKKVQKLDRIVDGLTRAGRIDEAKRQQDILEQMQASLTK